MLVTRCLPEPGVDTATYLPIKHTSGMGMLTGGVTADSGMPFRGDHLECPLPPNMLDDSHYGANPAKDAGVVVPTVCVCAVLPCNIGVVPSLSNVPGTP